MKLVSKLSLLTVFIFWAQAAFAQELASIYKPKNRTEQLVLARINALPEIKGWLKIKMVHQEAKPDMIFNIPDPASKSANPSDHYYSVQVGISFPDVFRTIHWLYVDPKTMDIYYGDFLDESGMKNITLQQWRYWRTKPVFDQIHKWKNGKLVASDTEKKHKGK